MSTLEKVVRDISSPEKVCFRHFQLTQVSRADSSASKILSPSHHPSSHTFSTPDTIASPPCESLDNANNLCPSRARKGLEHVRPRWFRGEGKGGGADRKRIPAASPPVPQGQYPHATMLMGIGNSTRRADGPDPAGGRLRKEESDG